MTGFYYFLNKKILKEYKKWEPERKLKWLYLGNLMRKALSQKIIKIQEKFRKENNGRTRN